MKYSLLSLNWWERLVVFERGDSLLGQREQICCQVGSPWIMTYQWCIPIKSSSSWDQTTWSFLRVPVRRWNWSKELGHIPYGSDLAFWILFLVQENIWLGRVELYNEKENEWFLFQLFDWKVLYPSLLQEGWNISFLQNPIPIFLRCSNFILLSIPILSIN